MNSTKVFLGPKENHMQDTLLVCAGRSSQAQVILVKACISLIIFISRCPGKASPNLPLSLAEREAVICVIGSRSQAHTGYNIRQKKSHNH